MFINKKILGQKFSFLCTAAAIIVGCNSGDKSAAEREKFVKDSLQTERNNKALKDSANFTTIQWLDSTYHDMGKVAEGQVVEVAFRFKNTGNKPLIIASVSASCGCTVPEKPEQAFAPGQEGAIKAKFDSSGKNGEERKTVYVTANTYPDNFHQLFFRVEVTN